MQEVLNQVPANVLVLAIVLVLERAFSLRANVNPLSFFKALVYGIGDKVHSKKKSNAVTQQKIAGTLAIPTLLLPFLFLGYMLILLSEIPYVFDGILLWMCLSWSPLRTDALRIERALNKGQKGLAKDKLDPWVLRETETLSPMGVSKTTVETLMLHSVKEYFAVIFYFMIFGPFVMLTYRLTMILGQCWNPKIRHYRHFGAPAQFLCNVFEYIPSRLVSFAVMLLGNFKHTFGLIRNGRKWQNATSLMLLAATAANLKVSLGGPAIYEGEKVRRAVIGNNGTRAPENKDIRHAVNLVEKVLLVWLLFIVLIALIHYAVVVIK